MKYEISSLIHQPTRKRKKKKNFSYCYATETCRVYWNLQALFFLYSVFINVDVLYVCYIAYLQNYILYIFIVILPNWCEESGESQLFILLQTWTHNKCNFFIRIKDTILYLYVHLLLAAYIGTVNVILKTLN